MDYNINIRQNQLENFQQFIDSAKCNLKTIFSTLGWKKELVMKEDHLVACVYDKAHRVAAKNLQEHLRLCALRKAGYSDDDVQLSEPGSKKSSILLDNTTKSDLFAKARKQSREFKSGWSCDDVEPKTADRLLSAYTSDERLALYNFSVFATDGPNVPPEFDLSQPNPDERELTYEERLENERNAKRRRIKYKSVHTNRKNHTEVIREVISNQMELYQEYLTLKPKNAAKVDEQPTRFSPCLAKPSHVEGTNSSFDETRSTASKHSAYSVASSQSKSKYTSSGSSADYRDRQRDNDYNDRRNGGNSRRNDDKDSEYQHEERRHSSREHHANDRKSERYHDRSRSRSVFSSNSRMHSREKPRNGREQRKDCETYSRDQRRGKTVDRYSKDDDKYDKNGVKGRDGYHYKETRSYQQKEHKNDAAEHDRRKRKVSNDNYEKEQKVRRSRFT